MSHNPTHGTQVKDSMTEEITEKTENLSAQAAQQEQTGSTSEQKTCDKTEELSQQKNESDSNDNQIQQITTELFAIKDQNTVLKEELKIAQDLALRAQAETQNITRRSQLDVEKAHKFALDKFVDALLPIIDSLERGLESADTAETGHLAVKEGMELTLKLFLNTFEKFNVLQIDPQQGENFDHERHQAISQQESTDYDNGSIISVFQKGYSLNNRLIRPAMVVVAKAPTKR